MLEPLDAIKKIIDGCTEEDRRSLRAYLGRLAPHPLEREWGIDADLVLSAIRRSSDLTKRGVRGIIAECVFVDQIAPKTAASGWTLQEVNPSEGEDEDRPYDAALRKGDLLARVQVKLQRLEKKTPKLYYPKFYQPGSLYVVEVQKTRSGKMKTKQSLDTAGNVTLVDKATTEMTRPYRFTDFDVIAVNMQPSSSDWHSFRYTVASWLLPRSGQEGLIEIFQPVAAVPNEFWTDDLSECLDWFESGAKRRVLSQILHPAITRSKKRKNAKKKKGSRGG